MLQSSVMPYLSIAGVKPDLALLVVISFCLVRGMREGLFWAFIGGLCLDLFSGAPFGASATSLVLACLLTGVGSSGLLGALSPAWPGVVAFLTTITYDSIFTALLQITGWKVAWGASLLKIVLPSALLNAFLTMPVYWAVRWLHERTSQEQLEW